MKKNILCLLFGLFVLATSNAQQMSLYTHYMYNTLAVNPAYAGSREALTLTALGRFQWVGFNGAPNTQTFTAHTPIASKNIGLGLSVLNDKIGPTNSTGVFVDFAYRMKVSENARLSFGLKGGFNSFSARMNELNLQDPNDASFAQNLRGKMMPNLGAGIYFQSDRFYAGFSAPKLLENPFFSSDSSSSTVYTGSERRHWYGIVGGVIPLSPQVKFKPTAQFRTLEGSIWQVDLTASFLINDMVSLGAMYRTNDAAGVLAGVNVSEQFMLGYSFDWSFGVKSGTYNAGSHEIMLRYDLIFNKESRIKSPRYF